MELLILRHAKSSWSNPVLADYDRPLKKRGMHNASAMGAYLRERGWLPDSILCSTAVRAAETVRLALAAMDLTEDLIHWSEDFYHAEAQTWLKALKTQRAARVMIVGHNPGLDELVDLLCGPTKRGEDGKLMTTAAVARIQLDQPWKRIGPGSGKLLHLQRPREL